MEILEQLTPSAALATTSPIATLSRNTGKRGLLYNAFNNFRSATSSSSVALSGSTQHNLNKYMLRTYFLSENHQKKFDSLQKLIE